MNSLSRHLICLLSINTIFSNVLDSIYRLFFFLDLLYIVMSNIPPSQLISWGTKMSFILSHLLLLCNICCLDMYIFHPIFCQDLVLVILQIADQVVLVIQFNPNFSSQTIPNCMCTGYDILLSIRLHLR